MKWFLPLAWFLLGPGLHADVVISEFLADNAGGYLDADGDSSDWIELHNNGPTPVDLDGWFLTDNAQSPGQWRIPAISLAADARAVIFASGKDRRIAGQELHTNFSLDDNGEYLALRRPDMSVASEWAPTFPRQRENVSFGPGNVVVGDTLVHGASTGKYHVPTSGALGATWRAPAFSDASWSASTTRAGYQTGGPRPGLPIAYWTFDNTTADATGNGHTATLVGPTYHSAIPAAIGIGQSLHFSGGQYVSVPLDVSETAYTCSMWFRTNSPSIGMFTVTSGDLGQGGFDRLFYLTGSNIGARTWNNETITSTGRNYANGAWHHIVHVFGASVGGQKVYVDGLLVASGAKAVSDFNWQDKINIGFTNDAGANAYFIGEIDDVAIWSEALTPTSISQLNSGVSPLELSGFAPFIATNLQSAMFNVNPGAYFRFPVTVNAGAPYNQASLRVRYDDAFVAWLDDVEIARRNRAGSVSYNSVADSNRSAESAVAFEEIDVSALATPLLTNGSHLLAIQLLNDGTSSPEALLNVELSAGIATTSSGVYFTAPTPGSANGSGSLGFVADTTFTVKRGWFTAPFSTTIACATPGATLVYTTNGSEPSLTNGTQVTSSGGAAPGIALNLSTTTIVRAAAFKPGFEPANIDTHTYLFTNHVRNQPTLPAGYPATWANGVAADYAVDPNVVNTTQPGYSFETALTSLPTLSLVAPHDSLWNTSNGLYYNTQQRGIASERRASVEFFQPSGTGQEWQAGCGLRTHGNSSRDHGFTPKHPLRIYFRGEYGDSKLREKVFPDSPIDEFDRLHLRGASTDSWPVVDGAPRWVNEKGTYMRDLYMRDTMRQLGNAAGHGRYVNLFLNGLYWGIYELCERPEESFCANYLGGIGDDYDVVKDFAELHSGNLTAWNQLIGLANNNTLTTDAGYWQVQGRNPDGTPNPAFPVLLHMPSFIDYMILHIAGGAEDWPDHNWWAARNRTAAGDGFHFFPWDQEISNDDVNRTRSVIFPAQPFESVNAANSPAIIYDRLRQGPAFKQRFRDRVHALFFNNGPLATPNSRARWAVRQAQIDKAMVGESARWGDRHQAAFKRETTWLSEMNFQQAVGTGFWDVMHPRQITRFRNVSLYPTIDQPAMSQQGGTVPPGYTLFLTTNQPVAYYTLDGTDPMGPNGSPSPTAQAYNGGIIVSDVIPQNAQWRYLVTNVDQGPPWRGVSFDDSQWPQGAAEFGYGDGGEATVIGFGGNPAARYITTYFRKSFTVSGSVQSPTLYLLRDDGAVIYLNGKEVARSNMHPTNTITWSSTASSVAGGADESTFYYTINLNPADFVSGTNVLAVEVHQVSASESQGDCSFNARLTVSQSVPNSGITLNSSGTVNARARSASLEWSGMNSAYFTVGAQAASASNLVVSELHYHPLPPATPAEIAASGDADDFEFLELMNIAAGTVDLTGVTFTAGIDFSFPTGFTLAPGARCVIVKNQSAFEARYGAGRNVAGVFLNETGLANGGESLALAVSGGATIKSFAFEDVTPWPSTPDGGGPSLLLKNPAANPDHTNAANWIAGADYHGTPAQGDAEQTFTNWRNAFHPALAAGDDDDGDNVLNVFEYAFALNPLVENPNALPAAHLVVDGGQTYPAITFRRRGASADLTLVVEASSDLTGWNGPPSTVLSGSINHGDGTFTETWRSAVPQSSDPSQFLRIRASLAP